MNRAEAIEVIRKNYPHVGSSGTEFETALRELIPELKESEDERIRKALLRCCDDWDKGRFGCMAKEDIPAIRAYLEKKKEQNGEDKKCADFTIYHPLKNGKGEYECIPYSFYGSLTSFSEDKDLIGFLRTCFYTEEECNEWIKQQKEQKPAAPTNVPPIPSRNNEQKPTEWSEEDEENFKWFDKFFRAESVIAGGRDIPQDKYSWFKSLRPSWKPSEEELVALKRAGDTLRDYGHSELAEMVFMIERELANWPVINKSIWKPNNDQIKALHAVSGLHSSVGEYVHRHLLSLYYDLQKLM